jgi:hypothetical protein
MWCCFHSGGRLTRDLKDTWWSSWWSLRERGNKIGLSTGGKRMIYKGKNKTLPLSIFMQACLHVRNNSTLFYKWIYWPARREHKVLKMKLYAKVITVKD